MELIIGIAGDGEVVSEFWCWRVNRGKIGIGVLVRAFLY
jgi:hypothetical protein